MKPGKARKITIQRATSTKNAIGEVVKTWTDLFTTWAEYTPATGTEVFRSDKEVAVKTAKFLMRFDSRITQSDRISFDSDYYEILYIREMNRREYYEVLAEVRS